MRNLKPLAALPKSTLASFKLTSGLRALRLSFTAIVICATASVASAVDYSDPNLSGEADSISRAALNCASFWGLDNAFNDCLKLNGLTDAAQQRAARDQAKGFANPSANFTSNSRVDTPTDVTASVVRQPASRGSRTAR